MHSLIVISENRAIRNSIKELFEHENNIVYPVQNPSEAMCIVDNNVIHLIIMHVKEIDDNFTKYADEEGIKSIDCDIIMISDIENKKSEIELLQMGATAIIHRPINIPELIASSRMSINRYAQVFEDKLNESKVNYPKNDSLLKIVGESSVINNIKNMISIVAPSDARVLITGSNGTGKEMVAKCLHELSKRSNKPLIEVNCAAIPSDLIESELFGHERGAFTSAIKQRKGKFELANNGTLFLDEIGDMDLSAQAKVLRTLQENKITRVGGDGDIDVNIRIIAATNKNLREEIKKGTFREDLFHRLSVIEIKVPSLNDRIEDIPYLVDYFINELSETYDIKPKKIGVAAIEMLQAKEWTGNIRELHNAIERLVIFCDEEITCECVSKYIINNN